MGLLGAVLVSCGGPVPPVTCDDYGESVASGFQKFYLSDQSGASITSITSSGTFKGIVFSKIIGDMFKWGQYQSENVNSFHIA